MPTPTYAPQTILQAERTAINAMYIPGLQLMRTAGLAAFTHLQRLWPDHRLLSIFCGAGNNAGDGYVLARLALVQGYQLQVYSLCDPATLPGDAHSSYQDYLQVGGQVCLFNADMPVPVQGIIVDALLGTGLNRQVAADFAAAIALINTSDCPVLSIDVPSGLHAGTGAVLGSAVKADATVCFIAWKSGLFTGEANYYCGQKYLDDLQLPASLFNDLPIQAYLSDKAVLPTRHKAAHKGHYGHVLLIGGTHGYLGAICLAAEAALRSGAGLVSVATRAAHSALLSIYRPEIMSHGVETVAELLPLLDKASVIIIGPGLGQDAWAQTLFAQVLKTNKPLVVDADALNLLAKQPHHAEHWILTPHPGEAARLLSCSTSDIACDRFAAVDGLQKRYGGVCVLKGAGSLVVDANSCYINVTGNPGMASGGMGDVLTGIIGGLLAQHLPLLVAARLAVYVHGEAADRVAALSAESGMLASDLISQLGICLAKNDKQALTN